MEDPIEFTLACQENWEELISKLQDLRLSEKTYLKEYRIVNDDFFVASILHVVCSYPSVEPLVIETILEELGSELASEIDSSGQTPLFTAINFACHPENIRPLLEASPDSVQRNDYSLLLRPIDVLCQQIIMKEERSKYLHNNTYTSSNKNTIDGVDYNTTKIATDIYELWECVHLLAVVLDPISLTRQWEQPILHACLRASANNFPYALLERAMKRFQDQFGLADRHGNFPLHICAILSPDDIDVTEEGLKDIALKYPAAAKRKNADGKLPLDLAIEQGLRGWDTGIADLLEVYPAPERFPIGFAPFLLAQAASYGRTTLIFQMLRSKPDLFTWRQ